MIILSCGTRNAFLDLAEISLIVLDWVISTVTKGLYHLSLPVMSQGEMSSYLSSCI